VDEGDGDFSEGGVDGRWMESRIFDAPWFYLRFSTQDLILFRKT
jgi:hypothetical protein